MRVLPFLALAVLGVARPSLAAQAIPASVEDLARASQLVVRGRVAQVTARWSDDGRRIFTFVEVETADAWRGSAPARVTVLVPGGEVGRVGQRVDGAPSFAPGEEVVVFLRAAETGAHRVTGLAQGKFSVQGATARPDLSRLEMPSGGAPPRGERRAEAMPVSELERRVKSVP